MKSVIYPLIRLTFVLVLIFHCASSDAQQIITYPASVKYVRLDIDHETVRMAYMDTVSGKPNGKTVVLFHGKNFNGYYWKDVMSFLVDAGFRVIVPDQVGFGFSDKPDTYYSFHQLAYNTKQLLDSLGVKQIDLIAHSMGGMLAARFILLYPSYVQSVVFENPIGLEDYRLFVPYKTIDQLYSQEIKADPASLRKYQQGYYPQWKPGYEQYVQAQWEAQNRPDRRHGDYAAAATTAMIYEQPVVYELDSIRTRALLVIGQADRTIVGKALLSKEVAMQHGQYPQLGQQLHRRLRNSTLVALEGVGHIPHIQEPAKFKNAVLAFLGNK